MKLTAEQILEVLNEQLASAQSSPSTRERAVIIDDLINRIYERQEVLAMLSHSSPPVHSFMD